MVEDLFAHAWARLDRAGEVTERMIDLWAEYLEEDPYSISFTGYGDGEFILRITEDHPPPQAFAVATGEWINHLRTTLDYTLWATAAHVSGTVPPPNQDRIQYPIYDSQAAWDRNLRRLDGLAEHHRKMLHSMQPFSSDPDANYLGWINRIARSDRHRHLSRMTGYLAELSPVVAAPKGTTATLQFGDRVIRDGVAEVARVVITPWEPGMQVHSNPRCGIDPEIEEWSSSTFWRRVRFSERLRMMQIFVSSEIAVYETTPRAGADTSTCSWRPTEPSATHGGTRIGRPRSGSASQPFGDLRSQVRPAHRELSQAGASRRTGPRPSSTRRACGRPRGRS